MHDSNLDESLPIGFFLNGSGTLNENLAVVGDIAFNHKSLTPVPGIDVSLNVFTLQGGVKFTSKQGQYTPYAQALVGLAHGSSSVGGSGDSETDLVFTPGVGVDFDLDKMYGVRVGFNYRLIHTSGDAGKEPQFIVGVVVHLGQ